MGPTTATPDSDGLIDFEAFQSVELGIAMTNGTSRSVISDGTAGTPRVSLVEFLEHGVALEAPKNSCAQGHNLALKVQVLEPASQRMQLEMTAKVIQVTKVSPNLERIDASLVQCDESSWERLLGLFSNRQRDIENFFKAAKGM